MPGTGGVPLPRNVAAKFPCALRPGADGIGGGDEDALDSGLVFLFSQPVDLLTYPAGHMLRQVMDEGEELVGRHDDDDAEDDQHGERAGNAENFGLRGSGDEHLKAGSEKSAEDVHENDGGKESRHHQRRTDDDGKEKKIASFAVLTGSAVSVGQRMGAQPERGRDQGFHNEDDPAHHGRNPANEGNGGQVVGQRQPVQQKGKKNGEQGKGDILVQTRNGLAYERQLLAHGVRHIHDAERRGQPMPYR